MLRRSLSPETLKLLPEVVFQGLARPNESCSGDRGCCGGVHLGAAGRCAGIGVSTANENAVLVKLSLLVPTDSFL